MSTYNYVEWEKKRRRAINALVMQALDTTKNKVISTPEGEPVSFAEIVDVFPELSKVVSDACDARIHRSED